MENTWGNRKSKSHWFKMNISFSTSPICYRAFRPKNARDCVVGAIDLGNDDAIKKMIQDCHFE